MVTLTVNGSRHGFDGDEGMPLLWYLRENLNLKGTKFGCGIAECGACTVLMDGSAVRACSVPMAAADGAEITTIEGLAAGGELTAVQRAWVELDVPQCGYCQAGQIMAATDLLNQVPTPTDAEIDALMTNICRCGTYTRIRAAIHRAAELGRDEA
ncbi:MAG: (2Fe-2S)-binding protein [Sphingomonadales bacterium]|nr:(2Fe-2S)-binding protein [Sphingomonadales bacterium]